MKEIKIIRFLATTAMEWGEGASKTMPAIDGSWHLPRENFIPWFRPIHETSHAFMIVEKIVEKKIEIAILWPSWGDETDWLVELDIAKLEWVDGKADTPAKAICIAVVKMLATDKQVQKWL